MPVRSLPPAAEIMHVVLFSLSHGRYSHGTPPIVAVVVACRNCGDQPIQPKVPFFAGSDSI
jgi:hypothetical protein